MLNLGYGSPRIHCVGSVMTSKQPIPFIAMAQKFMDPPLDDTVDGSNPAPPGM